MTNIAMLCASDIDQARVEHADLCMEEAGIVTFAVAGLGLCAQILFRDMGLGFMVPMDIARFAAWSLMGIGVLRHKTFPACVLMIDLAARAGQLSFADPFLLPSILAVGGVTIRALLARVEAMP